MWSSIAIYQFKSQLISRIKSAKLVKEKGLNYFSKENIPSQLKII
jgi:hypothetical protein